MTPKSKEPAVTDSASPELAAEKQKHDALDADLRSARAMLLQIDDIDARIGALRRDLFTRETFARSSSVLSPLLWIDLAREAPDDASALAARFGDWLHGLSARLSLSQGLGFLAVMLAIFALAAPLNWVTRRVIARDPDAGAPDRFRRALAAAWSAAVLAAAPLVALGAFAYALDLFDISDPRAQGALDAILDGLRLLAIANALAHGLLAPGRANWRLVNLSDRAAALVERLWLGVAAILAAERLLEPAVDALGSLNLAVAGRAVGATLAALFLAATLQADRRRGGRDGALRLGGGARRFRLGVGGADHRRDAGRLRRLRHLCRPADDGADDDRRHALHRRRRAAGGRGGGAEARRAGRPRPHRRRSASGATRSTRSSCWSRASPG